jgi:hypothetical protein
MSISRINPETSELEFDKEPLVECAANLYRWIMEAEEKALVEVLAKNGGRKALERWRDIIDIALKEEG